MLLNRRRNDSDIYSFPSTCFASQWTMPSRGGHELAFKSLRNINERTMSLERFAFFGTEVCKRRSDFWSETGDSMKITERDQPATDNCPWDKLITLQTVAVISIIKSLPDIYCRPHYYTHTASVNIQTHLNISARKQSAHKLQEWDIALIPEVSFVLILPGYGFVAHLVFLLI